ncbi:bacterial conjugation TrbI-like family protein [Neisseria musculi]|uniref:Bacterial conjugation TrbI-like family protein n=1 Tax=Neisseria musculi TaxID=1815583 RepID=A0A7H1M8E0_9NEIS|nr:bacterial conjugation TrbI-like family protein [Neisseria musculi]
MNLDPNSINTGPDNEANTIEPSHLPQNESRHETPDDGDFRVRNLSEQVKTPEAERGIPRDLSVRKISTMKKVAVLVLGLFAVGFISAGVMRYGAGWFAKEPKPEQPQAVSANTNRHNFAKSQQERLASEIEIVEKAVSEPETAPAPPPEIVPQSPEPVPAASEPPPDLRLNSPLMFDGNGGRAAEDAVAGAVDAVGADGSSALPGDLSETDGAAGNGREQGLSARLGGSMFTPAVARQRGSLDFLLGRSTGIPCGLLTRIVTTHPGITKCQVLDDVYSANGKVLLVEKGSVIHGEQQSALMQGQTRVFAAWTTLETPNGITVVIDSLGADPLGAPAIWHG